MARFFLEPGSWEGDVALTGDEAAHGARVLRLRTGDRVEIFDGAGRSAEAEVLDVGKHRIGLRLGAESLESEPKVKVILAQAVLKGKAMDLLLQKAVELGAWEIRPLVTGHTVVRSDERKPGKWERTVLEACKQCGRSRIPEIRPIEDFSAFLAGQAAGEGGIIASLAPGARPLKECFESVGGGGSVTFLVGPEGDFTAEEVAEAVERGYQPVRLGPHVLRSETAAIYGLAVLGCEFNGI